MATDAMSQLHQALARRRQLEAYIELMIPFGAEAAEQVRVAQKELEDIKAICVRLARELR
jgi:hypothetical protein